MVTVTAESELIEASNRFADAIVSNDADRIATCIRDDWRLIDEDGITERRRFLDTVRSGALTHSMMRAVGDIDVRVHGDVGVVLARVVNTAHFGDKTFESDEWTTDVFAHHKGRWVCVHSHVTSVRPDS
jgi:ketosteroid isomerase-like protein